MAAAVLLLCSAPAPAAIDLRNVSVERLDNGLTVLLLQDRNFPVVSVQMLYRTGARDETSGKTGLAHFLEHMAFRSSARFPGTGLVSSIYAVGGEWHGYTWTDETTYLATVPKDNIDLLLRIEADRMARLDIDPAAIDAERGAVLAEMHMYENSPESMLIDELMYHLFIAHPYRNNTIGFESDIASVRRADVVDFYRRFYRPANAVLAVVGDFEPETVAGRIGQLFGGFPGGAAAALPHTAEPPQTGARRARLAGSVADHRFVVGYRAPSANDPDFAAFLVLQDWLGGGSGVSFLQNDWGTPVRPGSLLAGAAVGVTTWFPPSAQDYAFVVGGAAAPGQSESDVEAAVEAAIRTARTTTPGEPDLDAAKERVRAALIEDVETTEDAAHQLAFFAGLGALDVLLTLPDRVDAVAAAAVRAAAGRWLAPSRRTTVWYAQGEPAAAPRAAAPGPTPQPGTRAAIDLTPVPPAVTGTLANGLPYVVRPSDFSPTALLALVVPGTGPEGSAVRAGTPVDGYSSLTWRFDPAAFGRTLQDAVAALGALSPGNGESTGQPSDPLAIVDDTLVDLLALDRAAGAPAPVLAVVTGDVGAADARQALAGAFAALPVGEPPGDPVRVADNAERLIHLGRPLAQAALGYAAPAPAPGDAAADAWQILVYLFSHDYEGRFGVEAISRRGLAYFVDARYRSNGANAGVTLGVGVDPDKIDALEALLETELSRLVSEPPTQAEIDEAKAYLAGRALSASQSNEELAAELGRQWIWYGRIVTAEETRRRLEAIRRADVLAAVPDFVHGYRVRVTE